MTGAVVWGVLAAACADQDVPGDVDGPGDETGTTSETGEATEVPTADMGECGDGVIDPGERCDDGEANGESAACTPTCRAASCGDGFVQAGVEQCDDGNADDGDECTATCTLPRCGDGVVSSGEACDDGDDDDNDACLAGCVPASCGDGHVQAGVEACDDGDADDGDECVSSCQLAACGDGHVQVGVEACDDGDLDNSDACLVGCAPAACGDGFVHLGVELCDDGNAVEGDGCSSDCMSPPTCNDGLRNGDEADVDCGGSNCQGCADDLQCATDSDCSSTFCDEGACVSPRHCRDIRDLGLAKADGIYPVDPDGTAGAAAPVAVFCEMTFDGGGWTAVFNMRQPPIGEASAKLLLTALTTTSQAAPVQPHTNSDAIHTEGLALEQFNEALFGWGPSTSLDLTRYAKLTDDAGLAGLCYLDEYCGPGELVGTFDFVPTGNKRQLYTGQSDDSPHVGLGFDDEIIVWGYDRNAANLSNWGNLYDEGGCCKAGNTLEIAVPGWRYAIYIR